MRQPRRRTYRKAFKGRPSAVVRRRELAAGSLGLRALESGRRTARQLEAGRRVLARLLGTRGARASIRLFPDRPVTARPAEVRRGKGKGSVAFWATRVRPGDRIYEVAGEGFPRGRRLAALRAVQPKLPVLTGLARRREGLAEGQ